MESFAQAPAAQEDAPFLDQSMPPWAVRGLAEVLLLFFVIAAILSVVLRVPETVTASFLLAPVRGADPVRAFREGIVLDVKVAESQTVSAGQSLFLISSPPVSDRSAERETVHAELAGAGERLSNTRSRYESEELERQEEEARLKGRLQSLDRTIKMNTDELSIANELATRQNKAFQEGISSWTDLARLRIEINRLQVEAEQAKAEKEDTQRSLGKAQYERRAHEAEFQETERALAEQSAKGRIRASTLDNDAAHSGNRLAATAPCAGTVLRTYVRAPGAVVREGDLLAEIVCSGEPLQAELTIPQEGIALVRPGQPVKLLYDAFPYQRYGVRAATVRWVSPASEEKPGSGFRALADLKETSVLVQGRRRALAAGMAGRARVIVGRRTLLSYAFEPLRQLKESLAGAPSK